MDVEEGTSNGDGTESSEVLQCLKGDKVDNGIREIDVEEGKSNGGAVESTEALQFLKSAEVNDGIREMDVEEGKNNGAFSKAIQFLNSNKVSNGTREMDVEEGKSNCGDAEFSEALQCLKSDEVNNGTREMDVEEGKSNCGDAEFSEALQCLKSDEVNNGAREMDVEEGKSNGGCTELSEALQGFEVDEVNSGSREIDPEEGKSHDGGTRFIKALPCFRSDKGDNRIRFGVEADVAGSSLGMKSDEINNEIRFGMEADIQGSSLGLKNDEANNGTVFGVRSDFAGWSSGKSEGFLTYKRRKRVKSSSESILGHDRRAYAKGASQLVDQHLKDPQGVVSDNNSCEQIHLSIDSLDGCSRKPWKIVLEHLYQSLSDDEGGIQRSIQAALESYRGNGTTKRVKEYDHHDESRRRCPSPTQHRINGFEKEGRGHPGVLSNGNLDSLSHDTTTDMCRHVCFDILISEKFTSLCKLLVENFQGIKIDNFFDLNLINSRMKDGIYDESPMLFLTDIQQVWEKLQGVGAEMISLA